LIFHPRLILTYLIPCHLLAKNALPTAKLLSQYPRLSALYTPLCLAIKRGRLAAFDAALDAGEAQFVKMRVYLTLERCRDVVLRNVFRKAFIAGGFEPPKEGQKGDEPPVRRTRVPVDEFVAAVRVSMRQSYGNGEANGNIAADMSADGVDRNEVECFLANLIYKVWVQCSWVIQARLLILLLYCRIS
jgi:COP9 signalosome complex subunit 12